MSEFSTEFLPVSNLPHILPSNKTLIWREVTWWLMLIDVDWSKPSGSNGGCADIAHRYRNSQSAIVFKVLKKTYKFSDCDRLRSSQGVSENGKTRGQVDILRKSIENSHHATLLEVVPEFIFRRLRSNTPYLWMNE